MTTDASCTLSELHLKVVEKLYSYLNSVDPTKWSDPNQIFYSPVGGWENIIKIWMKRNTTNNIKFPLASITRLPELSKENDISRRAWYTDFLKTNNSSSGNSYECLPVKVIYDMTIYDDTFNSMEKFCETLIFMRGKNITHHYNSDLMNEALDFYITYDDMPSYGLVPEASEKYNGKGVIYSLNLRFKVDGIIALNAGVKKRILNPIINVNVGTQP